MDDGGKPPHSFGSGQQRTQHSRPFFYVQPPSQPYYMYQHWHLNNPYNHYGLPAAYNFGRPYAPSYPYMQYPGHVFPPAHLYPAEYRQMFEPRFHQPFSNEMFRHHHYHPHSHGQRDTACSEVQTDPSDVINKVIEQLTKLQPSELATMRELDSCVTSQTSGIYSPGDGNQGAEQGATHSPPCAALEHGCSPATVFSDSTTAVYDGESSRRSLGDLSCEAHWLVGSDEEPPLDSSSVHEDCSNTQQSAVGEGLFLQHCPPEKMSLPTLQQLENPMTAAVDHQLDDNSTNENVPRGSIKELLMQSQHANMLSPQSVIRHPTSSQQVLEDTENGDTAPKTEHQTESPDKVEVDLSYQILKLPFEKALTTVPLHKGKSIFCGEPAATYKSSHLSSPAHPYYYNYLTSQTSHERMSVLSPSLEELSSRDEMFSTDLEDMDLFPTHVYASRRLAEVSSQSSQVGEGVEEVWPVCAKRFICACCGKGLAKGTSRSKTLSQAALGEDEQGDWDEFKCCTHPARVVVKKHSAPRRLHPPFLKHRLKHSYKRGEDCPSSVDQQVAKEQCAGEGGAVSDCLHCRTCQDGLCGKDLTTSDQGRWEGADVKPRRPQTSLQRQERTLRKAACNPLAYHRPRDEDNDDEEESLSLQHHREMGSGNRGPRY